MELAIISGKGGTGKSSISAAFAEIAKNKAILADCDVDAANLHILFNPQNYHKQKFIGGKYATINYKSCNNCEKCIKYCRFDAITSLNNKTQISEIMCEGCGLCEKVCPNNAISIFDNNLSRLYFGKYKYGKMVYGILAPGEDNSGKLVNLVRQSALSISKLDNIPNIVIDGPPGIGCPVISTITGVDHVLIVTESTISAMHDLKRTVEMAKGFNVKVSVLINKSDINPGLTCAIESFCKNSNIPVSGKLPYDKRFIDSMVKKKTITELFPTSQLSIEIRNIYAKLFN